LIYDTSVFGVLGYATAVVMAVRLIRSARE
jgi:hypothetical protein